MGTKVFDNALDLITFTRASRGTALRKISYGPELVTNGDFSSATGWTLKTGATITGGALEINTTGDVFDIAGQVGILTQNRLYELEATCTSYTSGIAFVALGDAGLGTRLAVNAAGTFRGVFFHSNPASDLDIRAFGAGGTGPTVLTLDNISVKEVLFDRPDGTLTLFNHPNNVPRIEYDASGAVKGLLVEEARTNLLLRSEEFDNASWLKAGTTITANAATAPDRSTTADSLFSSAANGNHYIRQNITVVAGSLVATYYVKYVNWPRVSIRVFDGTTGTWFSTFNIQTGVVTNAAAGVTATITDVGNGWYRLSASVLAVSGAGFSEVHFANSDAYTGALHVGSATDEVLLWGAQLEAGAFPTSYIPTAGAPAIRAADIASIPVSAFGYNQQAGSAVVEWNSNDDVAHIANFYTDVNNRWVILKDAGNQKSFIADGGVVVMNSVIAAAPSGNNKSAMSISPSSGNGVINGGTVVSDTSVSVPVVSNLAIGKDEASNYYLNGHIRSITYYPRRLSNAQLIEVTS